MPHIILRVTLLTLFTLVINVLYHFEYRFPLLPSTAHRLIGVALGLLLVYRTQSSYHRYTEGMKLISIVEKICLNLPRLITVYDPETPAHELGKMLTAYCYLLMNRIRGRSEESPVEQLLTMDQLQYVHQFENKPMVIVTLISRWIAKNCIWYLNNASMLRILESEVNQLNECQCNMEFIIHTPIPFSYVAHAHHLLAGYLITLPFCLLDEYGWYSIAAVLLIAFGLLGIEEAGKEIEDPFHGPKGIKLEEMCETVKRSTTFLTNRVEISNGKFEI
jgi:putative membrane protein